MRLPNSEKMPELSIFIDSGAYSVWNSGQSMELDDYIKHCLKYQDVAEVIASLDVIPGTRDCPASTAEIEQAAVLGWKNYKRMLAAGIKKEKLLHTFHRGEDWKWLKRFVEEGVAYIGIAPGIMWTTQQKIQWLDKCMEYLTDESGMPVVKFHGFGVTAIPLLLRYPWCSVDSTTWQKHASYGAINIPRHVPGGEYQLTAPPWVIGVTSSGRNKDLAKAGLHIDYMPPKRKEVIMKYLDDHGLKMGRSRFEMVPQSHKIKQRQERWVDRTPPADPKALRELEIIEEPGLYNCLHFRAQANQLYFQKLQKMLPEWPWAFVPSKRKGLL